MREQRRLLEQAEHWRHRLITDGTRLEPGTRLLEVGCGAGRYSPCWDRSTRASSSSVSTSSRSDFARGHPRALGSRGNPGQGDALALPFEDESFDHVWMMWFLEHVADPPAAPRGAARPRSGRRDHRHRGRLLDGLRRAVDSCPRGPLPHHGAGHGGGRLERRGHAAPRLAAQRASARSTKAGGRSGRARTFVSQADYAADVIESALDALDRLSDAEPRAARRPARPSRAAGYSGRGLGWTLHKSTGRR